MKSMASEALCARAGPGVVQQHGIYLESQDDTGVNCERAVLRKSKPIQ